jgi:ribose 5-phosphate isomerase A
MEAKKAAASKAVELIEDGMMVGLGTGSTAYWAIQGIGEKVKEGLRIKAFASSLATEQLAREAHIPIASFQGLPQLDITIDGADEVDENRNLIKGGGGALLREKILAFNSKSFIVIVDETKLVKELGRFGLPVEITPFGADFTLRQLKKQGCFPQLRLKDGKEFVTDNGNWMVNCAFSRIPDPEMLNIQLHLIPGVVETGLFVSSMVHSVIVGYANGHVTVM